MTKLKRVMFWCLLTFISLCVAELTLHLACLISPETNALLSSRGGLTVDDDKLGWRGNPNFPDHDGKGFRNKEVPKQTDIVALGDSMTYGVWVRREDAWPQQLALAGHVGVYNMGLSGYGPIQALLLLDELLELHPKLVIFAFYAGNDLFDSYGMVYNMKILSELMSPDQKTREECAKMDESDNVEEKSQRLFEPHRQLKNFLGEHSKIYALLWLCKRLFVPDHSWPWFWLKYRADHFDPWLPFEYGQVKTILTPLYRLTAVDQSDPRTREGLRISLEAIQRLNRGLKHEGIRFAVLLLPTKELVVKPFTQGQECERSAPYRSLTSNETIIWKTVRAFLAQHGIPCINMLPVWRAEIKAGRNPYLRNHDPHPTRTGQQVIARHVWAEIVKQRLLKAPTAYMKTEP